MKKLLLPLLFGAICAVPATADLKVGEITLPENVNYGETANLKVAVENDGDAVSAYTVQVLRGFTSHCGKTEKHKNYMTETLAELNGTVELAAGTTELEIPVFFELGGNYSLIVKITPEGGETVEGQSAANLVVDVPIDGRSIEKTLPSEDVTFRNNGFSGFNGFEYIGRQTIYPASMIDVPRNAVINTLTLYYQPDNYPRPEVRYRIYMGTVDADVTTYSTKEPLSTDMVLVYDDICPECPVVKGECEGLKEPWVLKLGRPFEYDATKNLVLTIEGDPGTDFENQALPWFYTQQIFEEDGTTRSNCSIDVRWYKEGDFFSDAPTGRFVLSNMMPQATFSYQLVKEAEVVELEIGEVTAPSDVIAQESATFRCNVINSGTAEIPVFTLDLLDMTGEGEEPVLLASTEIETGVNPGGDLNAKLKYTFETEGEYKLAMRVSVEGDVNPDNNLSEVFDLHVGPAVGVKMVEAGSDALAYADGRILVGIENAASLQVASADGRVVLSRTLDGEAQVAAALPMGVYVARVAAADGKSYIAKFIVK